MPAAVEELLRYDNPVQIVWRYTAEDVEIDGRLIREGQFLNLVIGAANRDPAEFAAAVDRIIEDSNPPVMKYDPQHPDADEKGYVAMPNINVMEEMVNMISATRGYEANVTALKAAKDMASTALEIGK